MRAKRSLGQNFLVDGNLARLIVDAVDPGPDDEVLEIGPGRGALTRHLLGRVGRLVLVELDDDLAASWEDAHRDDPSVEVVHADILAVELTGITARVEGLKVVGNIPYNITSPILFHLLESPRPRLMVVMVQREVAARILSPPGSRVYGALSVGVQSVAGVQKVLSVPRTAFRPVPRVDSTVLLITPHYPPLRSPEAERRLRQLTRAAFQRRRKQLQRTLRDDPRWRLTPGDLDRIASRTGLDLTERPERFSPDQLADLAEALAPFEQEGGEGPFGQGKGPGRGD